MPGEYIVYQANPEPTVDTYSGGTYALPFCAHRILYVYDRRLAFSSLRIDVTSVDALNDGFRDSQSSVPACAGLGVIAQYENPRFVDKDVPHEVLT